MGLRRTLRDIRRWWRDEPPSAPKPVRDQLAGRYLRGKGLEIGALHAPLRLPKRAKAQYVDRCSRGDSIRKFPELDAAAIVETDFIDDGFELAQVPARSQHFIIGNHVLEHSPNPLGALMRWSRVLRRGGVIYAAVPIAELCFDRGRPITPLDHLIGDYETAARGDADEMTRRNQAHYDEWVRISTKNLNRERGKPVESDEAALLAAIERFAQRQAEIHFHTFTSDSYRAMMNYYCSVLRPGSRLLELVENGTETIAVLRVAGS